MRIALDVLRRHIDAPEDPVQLRRLMDEQGLEVKRVEHDGTGTVFTLELLANRGDHHCYDGVARELDGRLGVGLTAPETAKLQLGEPPWELRCETELCLRYTATLMTRKKRKKKGTVGADALRVLEGAQIHSLEAPIDASNVANLELGQPTHAFDADTIVGPVTIRESVAGEQALPLFAESRVELPEGTLVIADDEKILAIAGVIGCEESKTTEATTRLLLESACFDPVAVRKASRALSIHTDSSARFERGSDPDRVLTGAGRVAHLLETHAGWRREGLTGSVGSFTDPARVIEIDVAEVNAFLATDLTEAQMIERLGRYGFATVSGATTSVRVPTWRLWDVHYPADLYEELAKSVGYDTTPIELPQADLGAQPSAEEERRDRVEEVLLGYGFHEVFTDGFYGRRARELLGLVEGHPLFEHIETTNAMDRAYSLLKNNCLHQAMEAVAINERRRTLHGKMFEWTRTFHPAPGADSDRADRTRSPCSERQLLWLATFSAEPPTQWSPTARVQTGAWFLKGVVEELAVELGLPLELSECPEEHPLAIALHPGRRALVTLQGQPVGVLGEVHPAVVRRYKIKVVRPCYLEIDREVLVSEGRRPTYQEPPTSQPIARSVAFAIPDGITVATVVDCMSSAGPDWLQRVWVVDVFVMEEGGDPSTDRASPTSSDLVRSVTFELTYANPENRRSADEVNLVTETVVRAVHDQLGGQGVQQR
ncbi:MAG: phenylalanine--tRNA ligase subunit beta [Myxococcales bacterium]|nr:phenylalanine--tRNA ligase subunit beta [Myxococcales bacterium]